MAFGVVIRCCKDYALGAVASIGSTMVYVCIGLFRAVGLRYYSVPGIDASPDGPLL